MCNSRGWSLLGAQKGGTIGKKFGYLKSIPLTYQWPNALIFGMEHYLGTRRFKFVQIKFLGS